MKKKLSEILYTNEEKLNAPDYSGVFRLIGFAIILFYIMYCWIGAIGGTALMITIVIKGKVNRNDLITWCKRLLAISIIPVGVSVSMWGYRLLNPISTQYDPGIDWLLVLTDIIASPAMALGLALLIMKDKPLAKRVSGWDVLPYDCKPSKGGYHLPDKSLVGQRYDLNGIKYPVFIPNKPGKHGFVIAKTGSGKSAFISNVIEANCERVNLDGTKPFTIVIDGKADRTAYSLYSLMKREAEKTGKKLHVIDIANPEKQIDVFAGMDVVGVKDALVSMSEWTEPHYLASASQFYALLAEVLFLADDEAITFKTLAKYCQRAKITNLVNKLHREGKIDEAKHAEFMSTIETTADIAKAAAPRFAVLAQGVGERLFPTTKEECENALSIIDAYNNDEMVLIMINSLAYSDYSFSTGALILSAIKQLISQIQIGQLQQKGILCICDELGQYASETITQLYQQGRTAGLQIWGIVQSLSDFQRRQNGNMTRDAIISNSSFLVNFSVTLPSDAEELANIYSTAQVPETTTQISGEMKSGMGSVKIVDQFLVHPRTIKALPQLVGYIKYAGEIEPGPYRFTCRLVDFGE